MKRYTEYFTVASMYCPECEMITYATDSAGEVELGFGYREGDFCVKCHKNLVCENCNINLICDECEEKENGD